MNTPMIELPDGSGCFTATILSNDEAEKWRELSATEVCAGNPAIAEYVASLESRLAASENGQDQRTGRAPTILCLCGSTRFVEAFRSANLRETIAGKIVLSIGCDTKSDSDLLLLGELTQEAKEKLDELHKRKIDLADEVLILNVGGYIGESTRSELAYARQHGKTVRWLEPESAAELENAKDQAQPPDQIQPSNT